MNRFLLFSLLVLGFGSAFGRRLIDIKSLGDIDSKISVNDKGFFVDKYGRVRIFHGFNSVNKAFPWYPPHLLNVTRLKLYKEWGFNVVRLGSMWSGVEPTKGQYNQTYLDILGKIIDRLGSYGLYSLLDMHQDVMSSKFYTYDGIPRWLVDSFPKSSFPYPFPFEKPKVGANWGMSYLTVEVGEDFQHFYHNTSGSLELWGNFWKKMASAYGTRDSVLAYELINEPWAGNVFGDPKLVEPGEAGKRNLMPAYNELVKKIFEVDNQTIIFYEPVTWGIYGSGSGPTGCGFDQVPGGPRNRWRSALSYHYYCWLLQSADHSKPYPYWEHFVCDDLFLEQLFHSVSKDTDILGGGKFLTEFGECGPDKSNKSINTVECEEVVKQADDNLQSWTYWDTEFFNGDGSIQYDRLKAFSRAYPQATAGTPVLSHFNLDTAEYNFEYLLNSTIKKPTVVYVPVQIHYQTGVEVFATPEMFYSLVGNLLIIETPPMGYADGTKITIKITRQ